MGKKKITGIVFLSICYSLLMFFTHPIYSQEESDIKNELKIPDSSHVQILTTQDGSTNIGRIIEIGENEIKFETDIGILTVSILKIKEIKEISTTNIKNGKYWFPNPNATRLYFATTGYMLKQGEGYFADYYVFFPMLAYGITNNITIGGGFSLLPGVSLNEQIFYFTPKIGLMSIEKISIAAGALIVKLPDFDDDDDDYDEDDSPLVGILYGVSTFGKPDGCLTVGLGFGFVDSDLAEKPMVIIGGEKRVSRRVSFVSENWIFPGVDQPLISYGIRLFGEKLSVDLALFNTIGRDMIFPGIPYIDFVFNF